MVISLHSNLCEKNHQFNFVTSSHPDIKQKQKTHQVGQPETSIFQLMSLFVLGSLFFLRSTFCGVADISVVDD